MLALSIDRKKIAVIVLRAALAWVFLYAGISSFLHPFEWIGYLPFWMRTIAPRFISDFTILDIFSLFQLILGGWLVYGKKLAIAAIIAALMLGGITLFNLSVLDVVFRDVGLFGAALALILLSV